MVTVNGWYAGGREGGKRVGQMNVQSKRVFYGEMGKDFCPKFI